MRVDNVQITHLLVFPQLTPPLAATALPMGHFTARSFRRDPRLRTDDADDSDADEGSGDDWGNWDISMLIFQTLYLP